MTKFAKKKNNLVEWGICKLFLIYIHSVCPFESENSSKVKSVLQLIETYEVIYVSNFLICGAHIIVEHIPVKKA